MRKPFPIPFLRAQQGSAAVELAVLLPVLMLFLIGAIEVGRFVLLQQKLDKAASAMADFAAQSDTLSRQDLTNFTQSIPQMFWPLSTQRTPVAVAFTAATNRSGPCVGAQAACIVWKYSVGAGAVTQTGAVGGRVRLPGGMVAYPQQSYLLAEATYQYAPMLPFTPYFVPGLHAQTLYKIAVNKPIFGTVNPLP